MRKNKNDEWLGKKGKILNTFRVTLRDDQYNNRL